MLKQVTRELEAAKADEAAKTKKLGELNAELESATRSCAVAEAAARTLRTKVNNLEKRYEGKKAALLAGDTAKNQRLRAAIASM